MSDQNAEKYVPSGRALIYNGYRQRNRVDEFSQLLQLDFMTYDPGFITIDQPINWRRLESRYTIWFPTPSILQLSPQNINDVDRVTVVNQTIRNAMNRSISLEGWVPFYSRTFMLLNKTYKVIKADYTNRRFGMGIPNTIFYIFNLTDNTHTIINVNKQSTYTRYEFTRFNGNTNNNLVVDVDRYIVEVDNLFDVYKILQITFGGDRVVLKAELINLLQIGNEEEVIRTLQSRTMKDAAKEILYKY